MYPSPDPTGHPTRYPTASPTPQPTNSLIATIFSSTVINAALCVLSFVSLTISICACCKLRNLKKLQRASALNFDRCQEDNHKINPGSDLPTHIHKKVSTVKLSEESVGKRLQGSHQVKISLGNLDEWTTPQGNTTLCITQGEKPQGD